MSHHFDKKIEERAAQLQTAVEQYNNALGVMNATKEQIISLQGSLSELCQSKLAVKSFHILHSYVLDYHP